MWEIDLRFATGLPPGWERERDLAELGRPALLAKGGPARRACFVTNVAPVVPVHEGRFSNSAALMPA